MQRANRKRKSVKFASNNEIIAPVVDHSSADEKKQFWLNQEEYHQIWKWSHDEAMQWKGTKFDEILNGWSQCRRELINESLNERRSFISCHRGLEEIICDNYAEEIYTRRQNVKQSVLSYQDTIGKKLSPHQRSLSLSAISRVRTNAGKKIARQLGIADELEVKRMNEVELEIADELEVKKLNRSAVILSVAPSMVGAAAS